MNFSNQFFKEFTKTLNKINPKHISKIVKILNDLRRKDGRLYIIGVGGSAGNASHAVNDFRKLCNINAFTPVDNVSEITAKTNDEGFETIFDSYLKLSKFNSKDVLMVFSVGGGNIKKKCFCEFNQSNQICKIKKAKIISVVGRKDGYAYKNSDAKILLIVVLKVWLRPLLKLSKFLYGIFLFHIQSYKKIALLGN